MNIFLVHFDGEIPQAARDAVATNYPTANHELSNRVLLIRAYASDPAVIANQLNISGESASPNIGVVLRLNGSHAGFYYRNLWDWLAETRNARV